MSYGIQVKNDNNIVQIDSDYSNYALLASGSSTTYDDYTLTNIRTITFSNPTNANPLIFIQSTVDNSYFQIAITSSTTFKVLASYVQSDPAYQWPALLITSFNWRVYIPKLASAIPTSGYGINVLDGSSQLVYTSMEENYLKIIGKYKVKIWVNLLDSSGEAQPITHTVLTTSVGATSSRPWVAMNVTQPALWYHDYSTGPQYWTLMIGCSYISGSASVSAVPSPYQLNTPISNIGIPIKANVDTLYDKVISYNSSTGECVIEKYVYAPLLSDFPVGSTFVVPNSSISPNYVAGPYTVNSVVGISGQNLTLNIGTGLTVPTGILGPIWFDCEVDYNSYLVANLPTVWVETLVGY